MPEAPPRPDATACTLGIDLGTSAVKVIVLDAQGGVLAGAAAEFPTIAERPGQAEQEPAQWLAAAARAVAALDDALAPGWRRRVAAIGLAGQLPTLVCLAPDGATPRGPAITWKDARADAWAATQIDAARRRALYAATGMPIDGRYLATMVGYHWGTRRNEIGTVLSAKDFLCHALTGVAVTDPSTAAGYGVYDLQRAEFGADLCTSFGLAQGQLPPVRAAHAAAGPLNEAGARLLGLAAGIPVTVGAADSVAGAYALGGLAEGVVCISMGSSTIILDAVRAARPDPAMRYLLTPHVEPGWYGREMDLLASGTGHAWLSALLGWSGGTLDEQAARAPAGARGLLFAPYLAGGEQGALWDPALRGAIRGLTLQHGACDLARAFLEGVYFEIRRCLDVLAEAVPVRRVVVAGGIVEHAASLQMLADVLDRPVQAAAALSPPAQGAALGARALAGLHTGADDSAALAQRRSDRRFVPGVEAALYADLYRAYRDAYPASLQS